MRTKGSREREREGEREGGSKTKVKDRKGIETDRSGSRGERFWREEET